MTQTPYFTTLKNRGLIRISGADREKFLQSLISNDLHLLKSQVSLYACLLTPQGKFLYDFFITEEQETIILDCEGGERATALARLLHMYKLRADIHIDTTSNIDLFAVFNSNLGYADPRHPDMGRRSFSYPSKDFEERSFDDWDIKRIQLCIPDGSRDMVPQNSTLLESGIDKLNGVSFNKGCYVGQEITARMHYRGLAKKHLYYVTAKKLNMSKLPEHGETIIYDDKNIGEMRSSCGAYGLALIKDEYAEKLKLYKP